MSDMPAAAPPSPCCQICVVDPLSGLCIGCGRSREEIAAWAAMSEAARAAVLTALATRLTEQRSRARRGGKVRARGRDR